MKNPIYFVTAIGTDSGKTFISAILTTVLMADYWKPIQAGLPRDSETVKNLLPSFCGKIHDEAYLLNSAMSPHAAAKLDNVKIDLGKIVMPQTENALVIEGAGGLLVPLNDDETIADLIKKLNVPVILVCNLYLGSINHSLLTINELKRREIKVFGIVFNGEENVESEKIILEKSGYPCILRVPKLEKVSKDDVAFYAKQVNF